MLRVVVFPWRLQLCLLVSLTYTLWTRWEEEIRREIRTTKGEDSEIESGVRELAFPFSRKALVAAALVVVQGRVYVCMCVQCVNACMYIYTSIYICTYLCVYFGLCARVGFDGRVSITEKNRSIDIDLSIYIPISIERERKREHTIE